MCGLLGAVWVAKSELTQYFWAFLLSLQWRWRWSLSFGQAQRNPSGDEVQTPEAGVGDQARSWQWSLIFSQPLWNRDRTKVSLRGWSGWIPPAKPHGCWRFCLSSSETGQADRLCCPCVFFFPLRSFYNADPPQRDPLSLNEPRAWESFYYIPLRCSLLWKQNKENIFYYNHLSTHVWSLETGPGGAALPPSVGVVVGRQALHNNSLGAGKGYFSHLERLSCIAQHKRLLTFVSGEFRVPKWKSRLLSQNKYIQFLTNNPIHFWKQPGSHDLLGLTCLVGRSSWGDPDPSMARWCVWLDIYFSHRLSFN